ncbi:hypothetical protein EXIGLDRAFT_763332 [Exidia glandulosa HHB12029]|uniref:ZC3H15/TMA46 family C-terminal domain-containing protein n=1 Tax=Exidia glandulosa HHB12029 TaxID=1314781 RepID=A0A165M287_EXIGL|nr:hypothetical protein EXIGLDRAFT_763332 [Exidia glandulosa HHB12029]
MDDAAKANQITLEEFLEVERHKLGSTLTPVTPESFAVWKRIRMDKKQAEQDAAKKAKDTQHTAGKLSGMSGRDLFSYNPNLFVEDDEEDDGFDVNQYRQKYREDGAGEDEDEDGEGPPDSDADDDGNDGEPHAGDDVADEPGPSGVSREPADT